MNRLLVANRGEIARRVIRTATRMGIETVAIYSDIDAASHHVAEADLSVRLPGASPRDTYLDIDRILSAVRQSGADAVHPGYGFLSESAEFARRCRDSGIVFVGPSSEAIELLGNKTAARRLAMSADVPITPGTPAPIRTIDEALIAAADIGYPVLLKAAAGGGGKGMRLVESERHMNEAWRAARGEAMTAFNSDEVFVEKYIIAPRHIELQILTDHHGNVVVVGERECSIQRRHQKVVEESPSPVVTPAMRSSIFAAAERLVRAAGYTNAGTLEFLLDAHGDFHFLEVNTRLQVEHPVTEMVTGLDLVEWQIRIARGEVLTMSTSDIHRRGHAIECRICAEDVNHDFLPSTGIVYEVFEPVGDGVRVDSALYDGMQVSLYYDPMLSKLIVWGETRIEAIEAMTSALRDYHIAGVCTTIPFCRFVMEDQIFRDGAYSTAFVDERWRRRIRSIPEHVSRLALAAVVRSHASIEQRLTARNSES